MNRNIGFVNIDQKTAEWLKDNLPAGSLREEILNLLGGEYHSLMLEASTASAEKDRSVIVAGDLMINCRKRAVYRKEEEIILTPKEFDILYFLVKNRGEVFTKEQIYQAVWEGSYVMDDSNIMAFIRKLRKKIELNPDAPEYILTIWGIGYKFNDRI